MVASPTWSQGAYQAVWGPLGHLPAAGAILSRPGLPAFGVTPGTGKITVAAGSCLIPGPNAATAGGYPWQLTNSLDVAIAPVSTGQSRIDALTVQLTDSATPPNADVILVPGVAAASPAPPAWPAGSVRIGTTLINAAGTITFTPVALKIAPFGAQVVVASLSEVASPYEGLAAYRTTDDTEWFYNGSAWVARSAGKLPKGGSITGTTDSTGWLTWTHNYGVTPSAVMVEAFLPNGGNGIPVGHVTDSLTSSTARTRFLNQTGGVIASASVSFRYVAVA